MTTAIKDAGNCWHGENREAGDESYIWCKLLDKVCHLQYGNECDDYEEAE